MITDTMIGNYVVTKSEIFSTGVKSYRAYVLIEITKKEVEKIKADVLARRAASQPIDIKQLDNTANSVLKKG
jgi:hypothetical protein